MNKNNLFAILMLYAISGYASDEPVVTKPYKPGFRDRHPTQFKAALTATFAVGAAYAYTNRAKLDKTSCAALGGVTMLYLQQMTRKQRLLDMLLTRPEAALDQAHAVRAECAKEEERTPESPEKIATLLNKYTKKQPLFLLGECVKEGWGPCVLSRSYEPKFRQEFESRVVTSLNNKLTSLPRPVQYVGFGCGGMLQDHVILTKTLATKPDAQLDIHLIDLKHTPYIYSRDLLDNTRAVDPHLSTNPTPVMEAFIKMAREDKAAPESMSDEELTSRLVNTCQEIEIPAQQSIAWLKKTFPRARLNLYLHDSADSYHKYIERVNMQSPDVIATADIQDEMSQLQSSGPHYAQLCVRALQKNSHTDNVWLTKNFRRDQTPASLASIALQETAGSVKENVQVQGVDVPVYITSQQIPDSFLRRITGR